MACLSNKSWWRLKGSIVGTSLTSYFGKDILRILPVLIKSMMWAILLDGLRSRWHFSRNRLLVKSECSLYTCFHGVKPRVSKSLPSSGPTKGFFLRSLLKRSLAFSNSFCTWVSIDIYTCEQSLFILKSYLFSLDKNNGRSVNKL